ncbi:MAG: phosphoglucosamine mutase [Alphaproteobacteria bacterium]|nr:phosphoglucosamine mutase [Alphaproteobacteria bacterium]
MTNKLFGTDGVRGIANIYPMNADFAFSLAKVLSNLVCTEKKTVAIGKDTRISGDMLESALTAGFTSNGVSVISLGIVPTPLLTLETQNLDVDMSLMITASHNPYQDNGIKLIDKNGDKFPDEFYAKVEGFLEQEQSNNYNSTNNNNNPINKQQVKNPSPLGRILKNDSIIEDYIEKMRNIAPNYKALQGLKVVLDCANGAYHYILPQTFKDLGAGVITINNTPNGININENCGTQHTETLAQTVVDSKAHFGIAVDGDGDRIILVDDKGLEIDGDQLICFLAQYLKKHNQLKNNTVITTEWSNLGLGNYLKNNDFIYDKSKVGERYVIDLMKERGSVLGGEVVGHIVLSDYAKTGDALATAIVLALAYLEDGRKMNEIFPIFEPYPCIIKNIRFSTKEYMQQSVEYDDVKQALKSAKEELGQDSTLIARKSGTEPVIKLRIEAKNAELVKKWADTLSDLISKYQK